MHADHLAIAFLPAYDGCNEHEGVFCDEVSDAAFVSVGVARVGLEVELESCGKGEEGGEGEKDREGDTGENHGR